MGTFYGSTACNCAAEFQRDLRISAQIRETWACSCGDWYEVNMSSGPSLGRRLPETTVDARGSLEPVPRPHQVEGIPRRMRGERPEGPQNQIRRLGRA